MKEITISVHPEVETREVPFQSSLMYLNMTVYLLKTVMDGYRVLVGYKFIE